MACDALASGCKDEVMVAVAETVGYGTTVHDLPQEMLGTVFNFLDLHARNRIAQVSKSWRQLIFENSMEYVAVVNVFEGLVWHCELTSDLRERFNQWVQFDTLDGLSQGLLQVGSCEIVKIWFVSEDFVENALNIIVKSGLSFKGLDLYPYKDILDMEPVVRLVPSVESLTVRPHGKLLFQAGIHTTCGSTGWTRMESLALENVTLSQDSSLPPRLTELEWAAPRDRSHYMDTFLDKLPACPLLQYLSITHADFVTTPERDPEFSQIEPNILDDVSSNSSDKSSVNALTTLLEIMAKDLPNLFLISFKFCKFKHGPEAYFWENDRLSDLTFKALKAIKFDLCYERVTNLIAYLLRRSPSLMLLSYECILTSAGLKDIYGFVPQLKSRGINLRLSVLQRYGTCESELDDLTQIDPPMDYADVLCRLDLSFVEKPLIVNALLNPRWSYNRLTEFRAIRSSGVTDDTLELLASACPLLNKLLLTGCSKVTTNGLMKFITGWANWRSKVLRVVAPGTTICLPDIHDLIQNRDNPAADPTYDLPKGLRSILTQKKFPDRIPAPPAGSRGGSPETGPAASYKLRIWDPTTMKSMIVTNYPPNVLNYILGFIVGAKPVDETGETELAQTTKSLAEILTLLEPVKTGEAEPGSEAAGPSNSKE